MNKGLVSVIIPIYNAEKTLKKCVESVLNQTYKNIEILCINDGSKDSSLKILKELAALDTRMKIFDIKNGGVGNARNVGMDAATGEFICFLDSDDMFLGDWVEILVSEIADSDFLTAGYYYVDNIDNCTILDTDLPPAQVFGYREFLDNAFNYKTWFTLVWNKIYRTCFIKEHGLRFEKGIQISEDYIFNFLASIHATKIKTIHAASIYHSTGTSISLTRSNYYEADIIIGNYQIINAACQKENVHLSFSISYLIRMLISCFVHAFNLKHALSNSRTYFKETVCNPIVQDAVKNIRLSELDSKYKVITTLFRMKSWRTIRFICKRYAEKKYGSKKTSSINN